MAPPVELMGRAHILIALLLALASAASAADRLRMGGRRSLRGSPAEVVPMTTPQPPLSPSPFSSSTPLQPISEGTSAGSYPNLLNGSTQLLPTSPDSGLQTRQAALLPNARQRMGASIRPPRPRSPPRPPRPPRRPPRPPRSPHHPETPPYFPDPSELPPELPPPYTPPSPSPRRQPPSPRPGASASAVGDDGWWGWQDGGGAVPPPPRPPPGPRRFTGGLGVERGQVAPSGGNSSSGGSGGSNTRPPPPSPPSASTPPPEAPSLGAFSYPPRRPSRPPSAPPGESVVNPAAILDAHNVARMLAGVASLTWDDRLAVSAQEWSSQCTWQHSAGSYGENLASGAYRTSTDPLNGIGIWYNEVCQYDFRAPEFSLATGHYSQMVWKGSRTVGCGYTACPDGVMGLGAKTGVFVCHYWPPGNVNSASEFRSNVSPPTTFPATCPDGYAGGSKG